MFGNTEECRECRELRADDCFLCCFECREECSAVQDCRMIEAICYKCDNHEYNNTDADAETAELPKFHGYCTRTEGICEKLKKFLKDEITDKENNMKKNEVNRRPAIRPGDDGAEKDDRCDECIAAHPGCDRCCVRCDEKECEQHMPCRLGYRTFDGEHAEVPALNEDEYPTTISDSMTPECRLMIILNKDIAGLPPDDQMNLLERRIKGNMAGVIIMTTALKKVWEKKLFRLRGFHTFEEYARQILDIGRQYAYRQIDYAKLIENLSPLGDKILSPRGDIILPLEKQGRCIAEKFRNDPEKQREVWSKVVEESTVNNEPITSRLVGKIAKSSGNGDGTGKGKKTRKKETISFSKDFQIAVSVFVKAIDAEIVRGAKLDHIVLKLKELEKYTRGKTDEVA
ncbi:MAG: hypothetical protein GY749_40295 [Desulfobacteraceae bacterium]|nr:hypothetical protein [Desulfobacteraceae bacterium]